MKTKIVKIGNSQGIRIPKPLIDQTGLHGEVELTIKGNTLVISLVKQARQDWSDSFAQIAKSEDDGLLDEAVPPTEWDDQEWEW